MTTGSLSGLMLDPLNDTLQESPLDTQTESIREIRIISIQELGNGAENST